MMITQSGWKMAVLYIIFVLISLVTNCMAMEEMPDKGGHASVIMEENELYHNNLAGIRIRGSIPVTLKACKIYSNGRAGIVIDRHSQVTVTGSEVFQNGRAGMNITEAALATIENNRIYENKRAGVLIWRSEGKDGRVLEVKIDNNRIHTNDRAGIRAMPQPDGKVDLAIFGNDIFENKRAGVRVENNTKLTAKGNSIHDNGRAGIVSYLSVVPPELDIYQNTLSFNSGPGINVLNGIAGSIGIRNNWIYNNERSGILCGFYNTPDIGLLDVGIINNTIVSNGSADQGAGIRDDSKGEVFIMNNIIAYNYVTGIRTRGCKLYSYNLLFANGDVGNCCDDVYTAPYWIERRQYGGCPERGEGDLIGDPLFVDPDNYDFRLQTGSPAIDAGEDIHVCNDTLFPPSKGTNRNDMGATGGPYAARWR